MKIAACFVLPLVLSFALVRTATQVVGVPQTPATAKSASIVWANRVFVTRRELARWLRARGASYARWAERHPALATGRQQPTAAAVQLDRSRAVRLLRSFVLGVVIAAMLLVVLTPIANGVRHRRSRIYVPALPGYRRALEAPMRAFVRTKAAPRAARRAPPRSGTPILPRDRITRVGQFFRARRPSNLAVRPRATARSVFGSHVTPEVWRYRANAVENFLHGQAAWYIVAAVVGVALGALLGYGLS